MCCSELYGSRHTALSTLRFSDLLIHRSLSLWMQNSVNSLLMLDDC